MPGTAHAVSHHKALGKRPVIMAAMRVDGKNLGAGAREQYLVVADMAEQHVVLEIVRADTLRQIRTCGRTLLFGHVDVLPRAGYGVQTKPKRIRAIGSSSPS